MATAEFQRGSAFGAVTALSQPFYPWFLRG